MRTLTLLLVFFAAWSPTESRAQLTEVKFLTHMVEHRMMVETICKEVIKYFPNVPKSYALEICRAHDLSKVKQDPAFLSKYNIPRDVSLAKKLASKYGVYIPEDQLDRGVIDTINHVDNSIFDWITKRHGAKLTAQQIRETKMIEHVSDLIGRGFQEELFGPVNGIYERGGSKPMSRASVYFTTSAMEAKYWTSEERTLMIKISSELENNPAFVEQLRNSIPKEEVEKKLAALLATSHYVKAAAARVKCLEAMVRAAH